MNDDNTVKVQRSEETLVAGDPPGTVVSETTTSAGTGAVVTPADTTVVRADDATVVAATTAPASQTTVQSTSTTPGDRVISHQVSERVIDPAAEKAATVGWINRLIWFIIGIMAVLLAIRFVLELAGANPAAGFAQIIDGLTDWMVAPFAGLFGAPINVDAGASTTSRFAPEILVAIIVYLLIGFLITKLAELLLGTNRTTGTVVSDTERNTRV
jgi:uncharacterized membrane protein SirB2